MDTKDNNIQARINELSASHRLQLYRLLKSHGVTETGGIFHISQNETVANIIDTFLARLKNATRSSDQDLQANVAEIATPDVVTFATKKPTVKAGRKVTIVDERSFIPNPIVDIDEMERQMKQTMTLRPSQVKIKKKIRDLMKKIAKHKRVSIDKTYGQEIDIGIEEDDGNVADISDDEMDEGEDLQIEDIKTDDPSEYSVAGENDDMDNLSAVMFDATDDDESKPGTDNDTDTEDRTDAESQNDGDDVTEYESMVDDELTSHENPADEDVLQFSNITMSERYATYSDLLRRTKAMDFGRLSELGY